MAGFTFKSEQDFRRMARAVARVEIMTLRPKPIKKWRGARGAGAGSSSSVEKFGVVVNAGGFGSNAGITALTGLSGDNEDLTPGQGSVRIYSSAGVVVKDDNGDAVIETWYNWMNTDIPVHTPVMGNVDGNGNTWVKVAPCGKLAEPA